MKFSEQWLREWVNTDADTQALSDQLTRLGLEVEAVTKLGEGLQQVIVGLVLSATRHPDADRLNVCQVSLGENSDPLTIVCGASNVRAGLKVAVAQIGAVLPGDFAIKRAKIRGVESFGMICSSSELGFTETSEGIMELPTDAPVGTELTRYLGLPDNVWDVSITPNRGDCFSILGLARELSASGWTLTPVTIQDIPASITDTLPVKLLAPADCPRYLGRIIRNIQSNAVTPLWMQERLQRAGIRSIYPVVDVMNYVMLELGQPLHAFDLHAISHEIQVRQSQPGEQVTLLNEQTLTLNEPALVIADDQKILALAGIMGGASSAVSANTRDVFIESAFFQPDAIRPTLRRLMLQSDAAHRFERGVDPELTRQAILRVSELVMQIAGGEAGPIIEVTDRKYLPKPQCIELRALRIERVLGIQLSKATLEQLLQRLNLQAQPTASGWQVTVPSYRFDLSIEEDLIEEIARLHDYSNIPSHTLQAPLNMLPASEHQLTLSRVRHFFADHGYREAINYSFVDPKLTALLDPQHTPLPLSNPISADMSVMRTSLWPALLQAALFNWNRQQSRVRLFEIGMCFFPGAPWMDEEKTDTVQFFQDSHLNLQQLSRLAGIVMGNVSPEQWGAAQRPADFFDIKGDLEDLFALTQDNSFEFVPGNHPALHPGRCAEIRSKGKLVGYLGELHPELQQTLELPVPAYLFELALAGILPAQLPTYTAASKYPSIRRDLAFIVEESIPYQKIQQIVQGAAGEALQNLQLFDIYQGQGIPAGQKSIALGLTFQLTSRTLIDEEVDKAVQQVIAGLTQNFQATLRE